MNFDVTISIHALLAESDSLSLPSRAVWIISIHALLAESDGQLPTTQPPRMYFYPRSPCGERRKPRRLKSRRCVFLSTLSLRRATRTGSSWAAWFRFLSTLSLRRATPVIHCLYTAICISIHALLAESDIGAITYVVMTPDFYPRSPCGERLLYHFCSSRHQHFYPRSPCGERRILGGRLWYREQFLSTLSLRRATASKAFCAMDFS